MIRQSREAFSRRLDSYSHDYQSLHLKRSVAGSVASMVVTILTASFLFHFLGMCSPKLLLTRDEYLTRNHAGLAQRYHRITSWRRLSYLDWRALPLFITLIPMYFSEIDTYKPQVIFLLFLDSWVFSLASSLVQFGDFNPDQDHHACLASIIICLTLYVFTKVC